MRVNLSTNATPDVAFTATAECWALAVLTAWPPAAEGRQLVPAAQHSVAVAHSVAGPAALRWPQQTFEVMYHTQSGAS